MGKFEEIIKRYLYPTGVESNLNPQGEKVVFKLIINQITIGELSIENDLWHFKYCDEFKNQNIYKPLTEFPDINKEYKSNELWPFFLSRIPGANNVNIINKDHKDFDLVDLLKHYGSKTTTNPYKLQLQEHPAI